MAYSASHFMFSNVPVAFLGERVSIILKRIKSDGFKSISYVYILE